MQKRILNVVALLSFITFSNLLFADSDSPFAITVPSQEGGFSVGIDTLYLRPSSGGSSYAFSGPAQTFTPSPGPQQFSSNSANYNGGFDLNMAYNTPSTGNNFSAEWVHQ